MYSRFRNKLLAAATVALISTAATAFAADVHWGYHGTIGPEFWGTLTDSHGDVAFPLCDEGRPGAEQSPIDLVDEDDDDDLTPIVLDYQPTPLVILNNGHTIQVNYTPGSTMTVNGATYNLAQFHFHTPSEHELDGSPFPMEGHLVHTRPLGEGVEIAVLGFFLKDGAFNAEIQKIWNHAPATETEHPIEIAGVTVNAAALLPEDQSKYFNYEGSLTTPPCTEGVKWHVFESETDLSPGQVSQFQAIFDINARPVQPLNDRELLLFAD